MTTHTASTTDTPRTRTPLARGRRLALAAALVAGGLLAAPAAASAASGLPGPGGYGTPRPTPPPPTAPGGYKAPTAPLPELQVETWDATEADGEVQGRVVLSAPLGEDLFVTVNPLFITTTEWDFGCPNLGGGGACDWTIDLEVPAGATEADFELSVVEDDGPEPSEIIGFEALVVDDDVVEVGPPDQATLYDGSGIELAVAEAEAWEGDAGDDHVLEFVVTASSAAPVPITFGFHTAVVGFGATPGVDHDVVDTLVELPAGATEVVVEVPIVGDQLDEADELIFGHITDPSLGEVALSGGVSVGRILDDDGPGEGPAPARGFQLPGAGFRTR